MTEERRDQEDRVVTRRAGHGTTADEGDERAYRGAHPSGARPPDAAEPTDDGSGGASERAGRDLDADEESEPTRSE